MDRWMGIEMIPLEVLLKTGLTKAAYVVSRLLCCCLSLISGVGLDMILLILEGDCWRNFILRFSPGIQEPSQ